MSKRKYTDEDLINAVKKSYSYTETCKNLGVSYRGNGVRLMVF